MPTKNQNVKTCDECESLFLFKASVMSELCPECSHLIYSYENCQHVFANDRCSKFYWDGSASDFSKKIKTNQGFKTDPF